MRKQTQPLKAPSAQAPTHIAATYLLSRREHNKTLARDFWWRERSRPDEQIVNSILSLLELQFMNGVQFAEREASKASARQRPQAVKSEQP